MRCKSWWIENRQCVANYRICSLMICMLMKSFAQPGTTYKGLFIMIILKRYL